MVPPISYAAAARFLEQATWGPTAADITHLRKIGFNAWFAEQASAPISSFPPNVPVSVPGSNNVAAGVLLTHAVNGSDQLRQRMSFALGEIWVVSNYVLPEADAMEYYQQMLQNNALSNYRQLMQEETLNPSMAYYLNLANNFKADYPIRGTRPNENYARELLQLFTIGISMLNLDGTVQLDANKNPIPTYDQEQIQELARVFTGWTYPVPATIHINIPYFKGRMIPAKWSDGEEPLHDSNSKGILGYNLPGGQTAEQDLAQTLDIIFQHSNVPPFVSKRLIQHFVTSNPSQAYVERVAKVFIDNGKGVRGDLFAVIKATLLDPEARQGDDDPAAQFKTGGHLREPVLYVNGILRALKATVAINNQFWTHWDGLLGQKLFFPISVFNYYSAFFQIPGTTLPGPEFQLLSASAALWRTNFINYLLVNKVPGITIDLSDYVALAVDPDQLINAVDQTFMRGQMPPPMRSTIMAAVGATQDPATRAQSAIYLAITSNFYQVEH